MLSRSLQIVGLLAVLLWTGAGVGAWLLVKDRVQVTVLAAGDDRATDDATALLADQVATLQAELRALAAGTSQNFERLGQTLLDDAAARAEQVIAAVRDLDKRAGNDAAVRAELTALRASFAEWSARTPTAPGAAPPVVVADPVPEPAVVEPPPQPQAQAQTPAPPPAPQRKSFLAVPLQTAPVGFDERRTWELLPALSRVGFDATSTLHDFTGVTSKLDGRLTLAMGAADRGMQAEIHVAAAALETGLAGRDSAMAEHLAAKEHPQIVFVATGFKVDRADRDHLTLTGKVAGKMRIRNVEREVEMPVQLSIDGSQRLAITGEMPLKMSDYGVPVPSQLGIVNVTDEVKVWIALRARALPVAAAEVHR